MRGVRLFPKTHRFALTPEGVGSLCEWLVKARMPLFLWHVEIDWRELRELATTFARLNIVVETHTQKILYHSETLFDLMRDRGNVLVETSNFVGPGYVEYAVEHFGAERLLFGSFLPVNDPLVPMGMLLDADIPQEAKALIAGGNLRRLVDGMRR
jgi:predicted TIM-barrel fold metal-dependent hydrolase